MIDDQLPGLNCLFGDAEDRAGAEDGVKRTIYSNKDLQPGRFYSFLLRIDSSGSSFGEEPGASEIGEELAEQETSPGA